jgi:ribonucleoside-triphosphate reductase
VSELSFRLDQIFWDKYIDTQPEWGPVGYVTYKRTYARSLETLYPYHQAIAETAGLKGTEEFWLTTLRVVEGCFSIQKDHCARLRLPWDECKAQTMALEMYRRIWAFKWLPPGRGLWLMGTPVVEKIGAAGLNNCAFVSTAEIDRDFASPFCFLMDMSMLGVGVGSDTRGAGKVVVRKPSGALPITWRVPDSREGWVEALRRLLTSYQRGVSGYRFNYSFVRPAGAPIRGFGGTASGPEPLRELLEGVRNLLDERDGQLLRSTDIVDIHNMIGRCVIAGNVRRSAEIMFGETWDEAFLDLKNPEKAGTKLASHRWASNNSVFSKVGQDYSDVAERTAHNGEPGYMWLENARAYSRTGDPADNCDQAAMGGNPCLEQTLESFELCCLVETFPARASSQHDYFQTLKHAYLYAKTVTLLSTHDPRTNAVLLRNRRIGTSMSGVVQAQKKWGRRRFFQDFCDQGYKTLRDLDSKYSRWLCVPKSIKVTSVKPSGTVSLLCGSTPGVHYPHSEHYFRVIRFASDSPILAKLKDAGYPWYDLDPKEPKTHAVYFPVKEENFDRGEQDVSMWEQLENAAQMQAYWADNQVSVTVKFKPEEAKDIVKALELYEVRLKGVSFLPHSGHGYEHAPYQKISEAEYKLYSAMIKPYDLAEGGHEKTDEFCDGGACELPVKSE